MEGPIVCYDGHEHWIVYPEDNAYGLLSRLPSDEKGLRLCTPEQIEQLRGWWWRQAVEKCQKLLEELAIPWERLQVGEAEVSDVSMMNLAERLALCSHYVVQVNSRLALLYPILTAAKESLEHAVNRRLAEMEKARNSGAPRLSAIGLRQAHAISLDKRLRNAKIEIIEAQTLIQGLEQVKGSLDLLWRTASRVISARLKEPIE